MKTSLLRPLMVATKETEAIMRLQNLNPIKNELSAKSNQMLCIFYLHSQGCELPFGNIHSHFPKQFRDHLEIWEQSVKMYVV